MREDLIYLRKQLLFIIRILIIFLSVFSFPLFGQDFIIQTLDLSKEMEDLNTPKNGEHTWWVTSESIDPAAYTNYLLSKKESVDKQESNWKSTLVPGNPVGEKLVGEDINTVWYLKIFSLTGLPKEDQILYIKKISDRDETYLNGILIGKMGEWDSDKPQAYDRARLYNVPKEILKYKSPNVLLIRVRKYFHGSLGIWGENVFLGRSQAILKDYYFSILKPILFLICYLTVGSYFIFLFIRRRRDRDNFYFSFFAIGFVCYQFLRSQWRFEFPFSFYTYKKIEFSFLTLLLPSLYLFFRYYFVRSEPVFLRKLFYFNLIPISALVLNFIFIQFSSDIDLWNDVLNIAMIPFLWPPLIISIFIITIYNGFIKKDTDARIMFAGWILLIAGIVNDILIQLELIRSERLTEYTFFIFIVSLALILSNRFVRVHLEVEDLNLNLEKKVIHRTEELQGALTKVNELKLSQDGDYFLTYLLMEPLSVNSVTSPNIKVEFLISQKKKFKFKHHSHEIGGDTCIAHTVFLRNRPVTIFLNADAMGKSMQGAGGILVLNSIFESIIKRTLMGGNFADQSQDNWLYSTFVELHNVFVMFEGSMMVSLLMGIIDDNSGLMSFINAEHPAMVLVRDEKADFISPEAGTFKLGSPEMGRSIQIESFQLHHKDVLILGSDGRDDFILPDGQMNYDSDLFLKHVEKANTDLTLIYKEIENAGEFYDDISLLRIEFNSLNHLS